MAARTRKTAPPRVETGADILKRINPQRRVETTTVCLNSSLLREFQEADIKLVELVGATTANPNRLNPGVVMEQAEKSEDPDIRAQARKVRKIEDAIVDAQVEFTFTAMTKDDYANICAHHRPRQGDQIDLVVGYDRDAVLDAMVRASLTSPTFETCNGCVEPTCNEPSCDHDQGCDHAECGTWEQLVSVINPSEWAALRDTANLANSGVNDSPKSVLASRILDRRATASQ